MLLTISKANLQDIPAVMAIANDTRLAHWTRHHYEEEIERSGGIFLVASTLGRELVAFIVGRTVPSAESDGVDAEIMNVATCVSVQRTGIGTQLIERFAEICRDRNIISIWLELRLGNEPARSFYHSLGFKRSGIRKGYYSDPIEDALVLVREL